MNKIAQKSISAPVLTVPVSTFELMVELYKPSTDEYTCECIEVSDERFAAVSAVVRNRFPGWFMTGDCWRPEFSKHDAPF